MALVQLYASGLIDIGDSAVASANDISSALATIQSIVSNQIEFQSLLTETQVNIYGAFPNIESSESMSMIA